MSVNVRMVSWDARKGYGFCEGGDGDRYFIHHTAVSAVGLGAIMLDADVELCIEVDGSAVAEGKHKKASLVTLPGGAPIRRVKVPAGKQAPQGGHKKKEVPKKSSAARRPPKADVRDEEGKEFMGLRELLLD